MGCYELTTDADDENVIEIFGRLNQQGVRLSPADLAAARLTGKMHDFRARATEALKNPALKGFAPDEGTERASQGGFVDTDLLVRTSMCLAKGIVKYRDAEKEGATKDALYSEIEPQWDTAQKSLHRAVKMFRDVGVIDGGWLPYRFLLLIPAAGFGRGHDRPATEWLGWAISASLWGLYAGSAETKAQSDAKLALDGNWEGLWKSLKSHAKRSETLIPDEDDLTDGLVQRSGIMLALLVVLALRDQRSLMGHRFAAANKDLDVHHLFPRAGFSHGTAAQDGAHDPDRLGNLTVLEAGENRSLSDREPSEYLASLPDGVSVRRAHCIPEDPNLWKRDGYVDFCKTRETALAAMLKRLLGELGVP